MESITAILGALLGLSAAIALPALAFQHKLYRGMWAAIAVVALCATVAIPGPREMRLAQRWVIQDLVDKCEAEKKRPSFFSEPPVCETVREELAQAESLGRIATGLFSTALFGVAFGGLLAALVYRRPEGKQNG